MVVKPDVGVETGYQLRIKGTSGGGQNAKAVAGSADKCDERCGEIRSPSALRHSRMAEVFATYCELVSLASSTFGSAGTSFGCRIVGVWDGC
ncbi:hypothetical protein ACSV5M_09625 [Cellvibrio sp. ARAG 10.3]|uniref:hypothetical protein n=1 Tax=Cellvibrio sp. ARAG 10.3 TaxID=3451358 RepID=UPI003F4540EC